VNRENADTFIVITSRWRLLLRRGVISTTAPLLLGDSHFVPKPFASEKHQKSHFFRPLTTPSYKAFCLGFNARLIA
jgi:hypothetical protein